MAFNAGINGLQFEGWLSKQLLGSRGVSPEMAKVFEQEVSRMSNSIFEPEYIETIPITEPDYKPETFPITEQEPYIEKFPITEQEAYIEKFPITEQKPYIETIPITEPTAGVYKSEVGDKWYHGGAKGLEGDLVGGMVTKSKEEAQRFADEVGGDVYEVPDEAVIPAKEGDSTNDGQSLGRAFKNYGYIKSVKAGHKGWNAKLSPKEE
jgi:hypothetical protein